MNELPTPLCPHCEGLVKELKSMHTEIQTVLKRIDRLEAWRLSHLEALYDEPTKRGGFYYD